MKIMVISVCPECLGGLPTPRVPAKLLIENGFQVIDVEDL